MATPNTITVNPQQSVLFNGAKSYDNDYGDRVVKYEYLVGSVAQGLFNTQWIDLIPDQWYNNGNVATCEIKFIASGTSYVSLRVTDFYGAKSIPDTITVNISGEPWVNQSPVANLVSDIYSGFAPLIVHLDASGSTPPTADISYGDSIDRYEFDSDMGFSSSVTTSPTATFSFPVHGTFHPSVKVYDSFGLTDTTSITIEVYENHTPVANLVVSPNNVSAPQTVTLDASGSTPPAIDIPYGDYIARYEFDVDGSGYVDYGITNIITHYYDISNIYHPKVRVTDSMGLTDEFTATLNLYPANIAPNAVITTIPAPPTGTSPLEIVFDASSSNDTDGTIVKYEMDFDDGAGYRDFGSNDGSDGSIRHTYINPSGPISITYTAVLRVTDNGGLTDTASVMIVVAPVVNTPPSAILTSDVSSGLVPLTVTFDGSKSYDTDGYIVSYQWDYENTGVFGLPTDSITSYTYNAAGTYFALLKVTDDDGATSVALLTITVNTDTNLSPVADLHISPSQSSAVVPFAAQLDAGSGPWGVGSYDPDGTIAKYEFQTGDEGDIWHDQGTTPIYPYTYLNAGIFTAKVRVTDNDGAQSIASVSVQVGIRSVAGTFLATKTELSGAEYHYVVNQDLDILLGPNSDSGNPVKFHEITSSGYWKIITLNNIASLRYTSNFNNYQTIPLNFINNGARYTPNSGIIIGSATYMFVLLSVPGFSGKTFITIPGGWSKSIWEVLNVNKQSGYEFMFPRKHGNRIYLTCKIKAGDLSSGFSGSDTYKIVAFLDTGLSNTSVPMTIDCTLKWPYKSLSPFWKMPVGGQRVRATDALGNFYTNSDIMYSDWSESYHNSNMTICYDTDGAYKWHFDLAQYYYDYYAALGIPDGENPINHYYNGVADVYSFRKEDRRIHDRNISNIRITASGDILVYGISWCSSFDVNEVNSIYGPYKLVTYCLNPDGTLKWISEHASFYRYDPSAYPDVNASKRTGAWGFMTSMDISGTGIYSEVFIMAYSVRPYANSTEYYNYVICIDPSNGNIIWNREYTRNRGYSNYYFSGFNLYYNNDIPFLLDNQNITGFFNLRSEDGTNQYFIGLDPNSGLEGSIINIGANDFPIPYYAQYYNTSLTPFEDGYL